MLVEQGPERFWVGKGTLKQALAGPFQVLEERPGATSSGGATPDRSTSCRRSGTRSSRAATSPPPGTPDRPSGPYEHRVVAWDEVGEEEGTGIVHVAPGCGAEDFQLGKTLGLPVIAPLDEDGRLHRRLRLAHRREARSTSPTTSSRT